MPPGFMNASCAPPRDGSLVDWYCASAMTSPSVSSPRVTAPAVDAVRVRSPWMLPMMRLASGADASTYCLTSAATVGSASDGSGWRMTPVPGVFLAFLTRMLLAAAETSWPLVSWMVSVMSDSARPNDEALVISRVTPLVVIVQRYSAWVCAETITLIAGSSFEAMATMGLPAR